MSNQYFTNDKWDIEKTYEFLRTLQDVEGAYTAFVNSKTDTVAKKAMSRIAAPTAPATIVPLEFKYSTAGLIATAMVRIRTQEKELDHENYMDEFCAVTVLTEDVIVRYDRGIFTAGVNKEGIELGADVSAEYDKTTHVVSHTVVTGDVGGVILSPICMSAARKIDFVMDMTVNEPIPRHLTDLKSKTDGISNGMSTVPWSQKVMSAHGLVVPTSSVIKRPLLLAQKPNFKSVVKELLQTKKVTPQPRIPVVKNLVQIGNLIEKIQANSEMRKYYKFYDIPRQWMNAPIKWGAVCGYMAGDPCKPREAEEDGVYFGAAGSRAACIFKKVRSRYDVIRCSNNFVFPKGMSDEVKKRIEDRRITWRTKDIFDYVAPEETEFLYSDVWDSTFNEDELVFLAKLIDNNSFIKFACPLDLLYKVLVKAEKTDVVILKFGRPLTTEVILTQRKSDNFDELMDRDRKEIMIDRYIFSSDNQDELFENLMQIGKNIVQLMETFKYSHLSPMDQAIKIVYRPFPLKSWMIPVLVTSQRHKIGVATKDVTFAEIGAVFDLQDLIELDTKDLNDNQPELTSTLKHQFKKKKPLNKVADRTQRGFGLGFGEDTLSDSELDMDDLNTPEVVIVKAKTNFKKKIIRAVDKKNTEVHRNDEDEDVDDDG